ncbi:ABC transporter permease [Marinicella pacifica]|uniref:ABC transporter permease n=1 Tax=Marinicella pacifica TaxID=1171543 RepID=A0A917CX82_9GAMM|nr:iron ABC transporter permease [Marinicella pacifica]GGG01580.1 ABC transporter permease [Marinicella pacifica]
MQTRHWLQRPWVWWLFLLPVLLFSLSMGSVSLSLDQLFKPDTITYGIVWHLRLPRALNAILVGGSLALAGLLIQNMVKNPLADPYLLGVSGGAASCQLLVIMLGLTVSQAALFFIGFGGSLLATLLVLKLSYHGRIKPNKVTLNGVVMAFGFAAVISFMLSLADGQQIRSMMFWLMGDLSFAQPSWLMGVLLIFCYVLLQRQHSALDLLARGELFARKSGVHAERLNLMVFLMTALLTSMAVAQAGTIGFVGLIIPHIVRLLVGYQHRHLLPISILAGALFLLIADTLARTLLSPVQLPVGIFTALIGVPVFLVLSRKI